MALGSSPHANPVRTRPATRPFILRPFAAEQPPYQPPRVSQSSIIGRRSQPQKGSSSIGGRQERACGLFDDAAGTTDRTLALRRLRRAVRTLKESITIVSKAHKNGISRACAGALKGELRDAKDRAERLLGTLGKPRG